MAAAAGMTDSVHWQRLTIGVGLAVAAYAVALQPVSQAFQRMEGSWAMEQRVRHEVAVLQSKNTRLEAEIRSEGHSLKIRVRAVALLSRELESLRRKEQALSSQVSTTAAVTLPSVGSMPNVSSTTGASGHP